MHKIRICNDVVVWSTQFLERVSLICRAKVEIIKHSVLKDFSVIFKTGTEVIYLAVTVFPYSMCMIWKISGKFIGDYIACADPIPFFLGSPTVIRCIPCETIFVNGTALWEIMAFPDYKQ